MAGCTEDSGRVHEWAPLTLPPNSPLTTPLGVVSSVSWTVLGAPSLGGASLTLSTSYTRPPT
jgi:hypothetical protein